MLDTATSGFPRIRSGQFRALAVTSPERYPAAARRADGGRDAARRALHVLARAVRRAAHAAADHRSPERRGPPRARRCPTFRQKLKDGGNIATPTTPEGMRQQMADEIANWRHLIKANNIKVD